MQIRLAADLQPDSIVDGEGIRTVLWTQGCPHGCKGCHNPQTHSFKDGVEVDVEEVIEALKLLTHEKSIPYMDYVEKIKSNPIAKAVKLADLNHNSDITRLDCISKEDEKRREKYKKAIKLLSE